MLEPELNTMDSQYWKDQFLEAVKGLKLQGYSKKTIIELLEKDGKNE